MQRWGAAGEMSAGYSQFRSAEVIRLRRGVPTIDVGGGARTFGRAPVRLSRRDEHSGHSRAVTCAAPAPFGTSRVADRQSGALPEGGQALAERTSRGDRMRKRVGLSRAIRGWATCEVRCGGDAPRRRGRRCTFSGRLRRWSGTRMHGDGVRSSAR